MSPHVNAVQSVAVQNVHTAILIYRLRLLVHQPAPLWNIKSHSTLRGVIYCLPFPQISNQFPAAVLPRVPQVLGISIADVMVILRPVRPSLLFMLGIRKIIPAFVVNETPVHPRHMQLPIPKVPAVDVGIALHARQRRAHELPEAGGGAVQVQVVGAQAGLAVPQRHKHGAVPQGAETRVGHIAEVPVGAGEARKVV